MTKLYIKLKVFPLAINKLLQMNLPTCILCEGEILLGAKIHLYDAIGTELYFIQQKVFRFLPEYHIYNGKDLSAVVKKELSFFRPRLNITSQFGHFTIEGNLFAMDFAILNNGVVIGELHKKWLSCETAMNL